MSTANKSQPGAGSNQPPGAAGSTADNSQTAGDSESGDNEAGQGSETQDDSLDESKWDEGTKAYISKLRKENAATRTKANRFETELSDIKKRVNRLAGVDDEDEVPPEEQLAHLEEIATSTHFENAVLRQALALGISGEENVEYFSFLVQKAVSGLEEGEELTGEAIQEIAKKVNAKGGSSGSTSTSVTTPPKAPGGNAPEMTVERFSKMSMAEKSHLYATRPDVYQDMFDKAKAARLI